MTAPSSFSSDLSLTVRTPEDVLAVVPVLLGFVPSDSIAMLTWGAGPSFQARVDLPAHRAALAEAVGELVEPAGRHGVTHGLFVVYTTDPFLARRTAQVLRERFRASGIEVVTVLRADGHRWAAAESAEPGAPYDLSTHPFTASAVLDGRVLHSSRDGLRAEVAGQPRQVARVVAELARLTDAERDPDWIAALVRSGTPPTDADLARLLRALLDPSLRDAAWCDLDRSTARQHVAFWTDAVRRTPDALVPAPAALLALAAWQCGHGALAWCALDRCTDVQPEHPLGLLVARLLTEAVPPTAWDELR